jgi:hypothetical protein
VYRYVDVEHVWWTISAQYILYWTKN